MFNISEVIQNQIPDQDDNVVPANVKEGSAEISGPRGEDERILVTLSVGVYNVRKATCVWECIYCNGAQAPFDVTIEPFATKIAGQIQEDFTVTFNDGHKIDETSSSDWTSSDNTVATVSAGLVKGVAAGNFTIKASNPNVNLYFRSCGEPPDCSDDPAGVLGEADGTVPKLSCTATLTRGASATCTVLPSGSTVSGWKFTDSSNHSVTSNSTSATWSGVMVTSGTISVTAAGIPLTASVTVDSRSWKTSPATPVSEPNGTFITLPVPPQPTGLDSGLGEFQEETGRQSFSSTFISDNGPNNGYGYYATQPTITTSYEYEINPDLSNTNSTFYSEQCGNYNSQSNPSGYISGSSLLTQTNRHEWNSTTQSHYAFYSTSISASNNPGSYVESRIAAPGTSQQTFDSATGSGLDGLQSNIFTASEVEPYPVNDDASGNFLGNINYAPYQPCN
jgi:hypothetical protein